MRDRVATASQFSGFPVWVLLDPFASFGECRNHTTALSLTSLKVPIEVSFELVDPPRVSRWFVHRVGRKKYRGFNGRPDIVNSSGSFMVISMSFYRGSDRILDYFVYKSGPGKPSLDLIPGPYPRVKCSNRIGILPSEDGGHYSVIFPVAELRTGPMYEIRVFSSADQSWSTKFASRDSQTTYLQAVAHNPSKAIAVGRGSLAWIDLWRGVLMCDGLEEDNPALRLIKWPIPPPCREAMDLYSGDGSRDATLSNGTIRFVEIDFHYSGGCFHSRDAIPIGWTATMWKRRCSSSEWEMYFEVDIAKILTHHSSSSDLLRKVWGTKSNKLDLNKVSSAPPTLSLTNEDVVYFMANLFSNEALLIAVNARKKKLEAVEQTSFELPFSPYSFSRILDASSGIDTANQLDECNNRDNVFVDGVETSPMAALDELKDIGGGRLPEEIGMTEANGGGAAFCGSAGDVDSSVQDKVVAAEHSSPTCTGAQVIATELSENRLINCGSSENGFLGDTDTGAQIGASELSENGIVDCSSNSIKIVNEGSGTELLIACTNGSQNILGHPAEREDNFDEYQDASPFLHQSDSEDGAAPSSVLSTEMNNLNAILAGSGLTTQVNSLETNGLLKDQFSGETNMTDLSADSKVGRNLEERALRLAEHEVNLKLGDPYEQAVNLDYTYTDMVDRKFDEASVRSEMIGCLNVSSLQETCPVILEPESESTCSRKVEGFMEDRMHVLHTMPEVSPRSEVVGSDNVQLETITNPSSNPMSIGSDLNVVCTDDTATYCSMEHLRQNWSVVDVPADSQPVENSSKKTLRCPTAGFQDDPPVTKMDDTTVTNVDDVEFTFEERPQTDTVQENLSMHKTNRFTKEEVCNKQIDPEIPTEDQFSTSQKHDMDQASSVKNPFNLDDDRNDYLFELPTESCLLEVPNAFESRHQVHSTSLMVDQPTVCNQTRMVEVQQCHNSNGHILSASSASENGEVVAPEDITVSSSSELVKTTCLTDHGLQENVHTSGDIFAPSQKASMELSTMQDISALSEVKEIMQTEDASAKDLTAVHSIDCMEMKQAIDTTTNDTYANVEEKKLIEGSAPGMNGGQQTDYIVEQMQATDTKELSMVQSIGKVDKNKQTKDTDAKEINAWFNAKDVEHKMHTAKEMAAAEITCSIEEKQQLNTMVGQDGSSNKQNEEIASTGAQLNSGRVCVPLKVLLAEASMENQAKKPSTKGRVLSFRRWLSKDSNLSGSPKSGSDSHHWSSPAKLPHKDVDRSSKEKKTDAQLNSRRVRVPLKVLTDASMENQVKKPSTKGRVQLPHKDVDRSSKENKQQWMPVICCHSVRADAISSPTQAWRTK